MIETALEGRRFANYLSVEEAQLVADHIRALKNAAPPVSKEPAIETAGLAVAAPSAPSAVAHTDHPLRHFDRTCPGCIAESAPSSVSFTMPQDPIDQRISALVKQHGSLRKAGRVVGLTGQYLYRLQVGEKKNPSEAVLRKLGLRRVISYVLQNRASTRGEQR